MARQSPSSPSKATSTVKPSAVRPRWMAVAILTSSSTSSTFTATSERQPGLRTLNAR